MDLDCTFYFWKRKLFSAVMGVAFAGAVFGTPTLTPFRKRGFPLAPDP